MNLLALLDYGRKALSDAGCENASFDALCLLEYASGLSRTEIFIDKESEQAKDTESNYIKLIIRRAEGEPLQYILGKWEFMGLEFCVGPGVLIPRSETEGLVELAVEKIGKKKNAVVFDLCAGSGCIGISIANACKNAEVYLIENSETAFEYLNKNLIKSESINTTGILGDILKGFLSYKLPRPDLIVSNPPYIPSDEIADLQKEVLFEPKTALDGGADGLDFYRAISALWLPYLCSSGMLAVECGDNQADSVANLFTRKSQSINFAFDINRIKRFVVVET